MSVSTPRRSRSWLPLLAGGAAVALLALSAVAELPTRLVWNASASVPVGLYAVRPADRIRTGVLVLVRPPERIAAYMDERRYVPRGVPLLKRVEALASDTVCRRGDIVTVNGEPRAVALAADRFGRPLPVWSGCRRLQNGQVFLLNRDAPESFDGRYFGVLPASLIIGRATPLMIPEAGR